MTGTCSACGTTRDLAGLLRVSETGGLHRSRYVCRPDVDGRCFGSVGPRSAETVVLAADPSPLGLSAADELAAANDGRSTRLIADALYDRGRR